MQAADMNWIELAKVAIAVTVFLAPLVWALIVYHGDRRWVTVAQLNGLGGKISAMETLYIQTRERVDTNQDRLTLLEQAQKNEQMRITEVLINPMREMADELHELRKGQEEHGRCLVKTEEALKGVLRSLDELRVRINGGGK